MPRRPISLEGSHGKPYRTYMRSRFSRGKILWIVAGLSIIVSSAAPVQLSREQGDSLEQKIDEINKNALREPVKPKRTSMSENEVNSYLAYNIKDKIPRGLTRPEIRIVGNNQLAGRVLVDMDDFKRNRSPGGVMDALSYISGQVPLTARGWLRSQEGKGRFQLISAEILGVPLPKPVVQELVSFFSRSAEKPNGFDLDAPFDLPAKIRVVEVNQGEAVVVQ
jgi:hypothetical protein